MALDVRGVESNGVSEWYLLATPDEDASPVDQARQAFSAVADALRSRNAAIFQERVFAPVDAVPDLRPLRIEVYGDLHDGVEPCWLAGGGQVAVQVHALGGPQRPIAMNGVGKGHARSFRHHDKTWITASDLGADPAVSPHEQARIALERAEAILSQSGGDLRNVARTWFFMDRILDWYGDFNKVRTRLFIERGVMTPGARDDRMPASTGIGVSPARPGRCALDLFAVLGDPVAIRRYHAAGRQRSAYEYGSAFARAARVTGPASRTVFVSGTAAIDATGATCFVNDISGQIRMTMENVLAVLREMNCSPDQVVQAIAYCVNPEVERCFRSGWFKQLNWPWIVVAGDVCRGDLLFEVEATACQRA